MQSVDNSQPRGVGLRLLTDDAGQLLRRDLPCRRVSIGSRQQDKYLVASPMLQSDFSPTTGTPLRNLVR